MINYASLAGFVIGLVCTGVYVFFLTPRQLKEVVRPYDGLTRLRWTIFFILLFSIIAAIPGLVYTYFRSFGHNYHILQNIAVITGNISRLGTTALLVLVYTYRRKDN